MILSLKAPNYCLPANIQRVCQSINGWLTKYWLLPTRRCNMSHFKCQHARNWKFFKDRIISQNLWPPRSPDLTPADFFLWGLLKIKVYKNTLRTIEQLKEDAILHETEAVSTSTLQEQYSRIWRNAFKSAYMWKETIFSIDYEQVLFCIVPGICI